jgi:hypothetical protein
VHRFGWLMVSTSIMKSYRSILAASNKKITILGVLYLANRFLKLNKFVSKLIIHNIEYSHLS